MVKTATILEQGQLSFTIESRIIRELGERLVKQPEIALLELIKNSYDADAKKCTLSFQPSSISVIDDGVGMTLSEFKLGWMRIGTSAKEVRTHTREYLRPITGEKGIGRFAVRFLGRKLKLRSVAVDERSAQRTILTAEFDWPEFDRNLDLGNVKVPFVLRAADPEEPIGTILTIEQLRPGASEVDFRLLRTSSLNVITPYQSLLKLAPEDREAKRTGQKEDPGFKLELGEGLKDDEEIDATDVANEILDNFVLRAVLEVSGKRVSISVYQKGDQEPVLSLKDDITNLVGKLFGDIRFFPQRGGTFQNLKVNGQRARAWVKEHAGVAVYDRAFRVYPYGTSGDDWLHLTADTAVNLRNPRSSVAQKFLVMDEPTRLSTQENYMLSLPHNAQLVGVVQAYGQRNKDQGSAPKGLVVSADREGFVHNDAYLQMEDLVRSAVEAIAYADREIQLRKKAEEKKLMLSALRRETRSAIREIESNPDISTSVKFNLVRNLTNTQRTVDAVEELSKERESSLEVMSLLGVIAGFMTHEFGTALSELEKAHNKLAKLAKKDISFSQDATSIANSIATLRDFVTYSQGYIQGASQRPTKPYPVKPRLQQIIRVFGNYAEERGITVSVEVDSNLMSPMVPVSLYNGIALNLYTNGLKAVTAKSGQGRKEVAFRAWDEKQWHILEVSDTGVGIPSALRSRVFDPLFTTTSSNRDPLGSGMGLGLSLVRRSVQAFDGKVDLTDPPPGFSTCFRVRLPFKE
jgi:signal transduction histidine kinase